MRYPNLRYGNPAELQHYAMPFTLAALARMLRRDQRTVRDWLNCRTRVPWWVPELLRLRHMEASERHRQMTGAPMLARLGIVGADVIELHRPRIEKKPQLTELRLSDFDAEPRRATG